MSFGAAAQGSASENPFLAPWATRFGVPPFDEIAPNHFRPAFEQALGEHVAEVDAIAASTAPPTFDNTVGALERAGRLLERVSLTFFNLAHSHTNEDLEAIEREMAPRLAAHSSAIFMNERLFDRIGDLHAAREVLNLSAEEKRTLDRYHTMFVRMGARLDSDAKARLKAVLERLASLGTAFSQNVLADERDYTLVLEGERDLAGLPDFVRAAAARAAEERGLEGKHVITLARSSIEPFLQFSERRDLRESAFKAWTSRGENAGARDNRPIIAEIVALRAERAKLLGFGSFADFKLDDTMARTAAAATSLLREVWEPARRRALRERDALQALVQGEGGNFDIAPWDWRFYAEKLRKAEHDFDEAELKPYLQLDQIIAAAFDTAHRLFGLSFSPLADAALYHPDARAWEVADADGRHVGVFVGDYFARPSKRSGAWMSAYRTQEKLNGDVRPIIVNNMNFSKGASDEPPLLSFDDARTLFHEFGHALHGLLSDVTFPLLAGTAVAGDFVELPSQLYEHWLEQPEVLGRFARHYRTGEPMPKALIDRVLAARTFNQGFATVEFTASALIDMDLHRMGEPGDIDVVEFERRELDRIGMPKEITARHRVPHFSHVFAGDGYAAGYYSYLWSEVLDADAFDAFREAGDVFDAATARRLRDFVYAAGNLRDPTEAYVAFRGRMPDTMPMLRKRGLVEDGGCPP